MLGIIVQAILSRYELLSLLETECRRDLGYKDIKIACI
jgi:hypothetical protein